MRGPQFLFVSSIALACTRAPAAGERTPNAATTAPVKDTSATGVDASTGVESNAGSRQPNGDASRANGDNAASAPDAPIEPETKYAFQEPLPPRELARDAPAIVAANLAPQACLAELRRRKLPVERDTGAAAGIAVPVRITDAMHGVQFIAPGRKSVYGKLDCRLALALDELARVLERHAVVAVRVDNLYRPRARLPGRRTRSQHRYGLAIDLVSFGLADGSELSVELDWQGDRESPPCGPESRLLEATPAAVALRTIVCDVARSGIFHHILTPSYNEAHRDHLHFDIKRGEKRYLIE